MDKPMERKGLSRLVPPQKMNQKPMGKPYPEKKQGGAVHGEMGAQANGGEKTHTITEHGDGSHTSTMHDGTTTEHPSHLHMMAHLGHHLTGGDKHMVSHHDGMSVHSHGIHESGEHDGPHEHGSGEEAGAHMAQFMGGEGEQESPEEDQGEHEMQETYGGM